MATFKAVVFSHQRRSDGTYNIKIRVSHKRYSKYISTPFYVCLEDLNRSFQIKNRKYIDKTQDLIRSYRDKCDNCGELINSMTIDQVVELVTSNPEGQFKLDIIAFGRKLIDDMRTSGHNGNAINYEIALNNLIKFTGKTSIDINDISSVFVREWIRWIQMTPSKNKREKGNRAQSLYPSILRAIHNKAKDDFNNEDSGMIRIPLSPFKKLPKSPQTRKRAIDALQIQEIIKLEYNPISRPNANRFNLAKDVFLLSFGLIGMNAVDLYNCEHYENGRITYQRTKTKNRRDDNAEISINVEPELQALFNKYIDPSKEKVFIFHKLYSSVKNFNYSLNKGLKQIGEALNLEDLEFYAARHSWATIAVNDAGVDKFTVHTALNHVDEQMRVTDIYIKKSWDPIDKANRKVLDYVKFKIDTVEEPFKNKVNKG